MAIEVGTDAANVIRSDIGRSTFGSGIAFSTSQLRWTMDNLAAPESAAVSSKTRDAMKALNLGTLRFPNGDSSFMYVPDDPQASYPTLKEVTMWNRYLTPDDIVRYTAPGELNMERLFEVNTAYWLDKGHDWTMRYLNDHQLTEPRVAPVLNTSHLSDAARKAADWVRRDNGQTQFWEVGNEDWSRWNGAQHAEIFQTFQQKMKAVRPGIKLLAQGLAEDFNGNTPAAWFGALKTKLEDSGSVDSVYAYSVHQYVSSAPYDRETDPVVRRRKQTQDMLAEVAGGKPVDAVKTLLGTGSTTASTRHWKIWMTEFNVHQPSGRTNADGDVLFDPVQDMGHALVIADWTGKLLEQNVERLFIHSLDHSPEFALVQYANLGADIEHPRTTVPGQAFSLYAQQFGRTMVRNSTTGNPTLTAPNGKPYLQVAAYSSISADNTALRIVVVNRHLTDSARVTINTRATASRRLLADGHFAVRQLRAARITDNNSASEAVKWTDAAYHPQTQAGGTGTLLLPPASVSLFVVPLQ